MKKMAVIATGLLSLGCLGAFEMPAFNVDTSVKFSTESAFRGYRKTERAFLPKVEVGLPVFEKGSAYVGVESVLALKSASVLYGMYDRNEVTPYLGLSYDITDRFTLDCGYTHRFWTNPPSEAEFVFSKGHARADSGEVHVGVTADVLFSPSLCLAYNYRWKEVAVEGCVAYAYDLAQFGLSGVAVEFGAKVGYDKVDRPYGISAGKAEALLKQIFPNTYSEKTFRAIGIGKAHWFYGANADLVYSFNEHARARVGVEVVGNSAKKESWQNYFGASPKTMLWFNASVDCSF